jgi:hypothetical protein
VTTADPDALRRQAAAEAAGRLAHLPSDDEQQEGAALYRRPDGSDDWPDIHGRHTKTANVLHSALQLARFPGCDTCRIIAEGEARSHNAGNHTHYDPRTGQPVTHDVADCPLGFTPSGWRDGRCHCDVCQTRRAAIGF